MRAELRRTIAPLVVVGLVSALTWLGLRLWDSRQSARGQSIARTRYALHRLAVQSEVARLPRKAYPTADLVSALALECEFTEWLPVETETGHVLDSWGNPIWLTPVTDTQAGVVLLSYGPNGVDEGGQGDDVTHRLRLHNVENGGDREGLGSDKAPNSKTGVPQKGGINGIIGTRWEIADESAVLSTTDIWDVNAKHRFRFSCRLLSELFNARIWGSGKLPELPPCCPLRCDTQELGITLHAPFK